MPLHFSTEPSLTYFVTRFVGHVDDGQLFDYYGKVYSRPELNPMKDEFVDLSEADMAGVTTLGLEELSRRISTIFSNMGVESVKTAIYSPNDIPFALGRVYQAWTEISPELVAVFRDDEEAIAWLCE